MSTNSTGQNEDMASHTLGEIIAGGVTLHLVDSELSYTSTSTDISNASVKSASLAESDLNIVLPADYTGTATIETAVDVVFDVSSSTATIVEVVLQNASNTGRFVLVDETNDPDLSSYDEYKIPSGEVLYELGNA